MYYLFISTYRETFILDIARILHQGLFIYNYSIILFVVDGLEHCSSWFDSNKQLLIKEYAKRKR